MMLVTHSHELPFRSFRCLRLKRHECSKVEQKNEEKKSVKIVTNIKDKEICPIMLKDELVLNRDKGRAFR